MTTLIYHAQSGGDYPEDVGVIRGFIPGGFIKSNVEAIYWWERMSEEVYSAGWMAVDEHTLKALLAFMGRERR